MERLNPEDPAIRPVHVSREEHLDWSSRRSTELASSERDRFESAAGAMVGIEIAFPEWLGVRQDGRIFFVRIAEIERIEAQRNNVILHTREQRLRMHRTITRLESILDPRVFVRIQRSTIVRIDLIHYLTPHSSKCYFATLKDGTRLTLSRVFVDRSVLLREVLGEGNHRLPHVLMSESTHATEEEEP